MTVLGDFFPGDDVRDHIERQLTPGRVLYLWCNFIDPPKNKYVVLLWKRKNCLLFMINSNIVRFIQADEHLRSLQIKLKVTEYGFLDYDSWINCMDVKSIALEEIQKQLMQDVSRIKDELTLETREQVRMVVGTAQTISPLHKKLIMSSLQI